MAALEIPPLTERPNSRFLRLRTVVERVALSRSQLYRLVARGTFPRSYRLGARAVGWLECEIEDWIRARIKSQGVPASASQSARTEAM
jgi:prophage regulatory protein